MLIASAPPVVILGCSRGLKACICEVCELAGVCLVEQNVADEVNQVSLELSHAALSLSGDHGLRAGRGLVSSRSSLPHCTRFAYVCAILSECQHVHCKNHPIWHSNLLKTDS